MIIYIYVNIKGNNEFIKKIIDIYIIKFNFISINAFKIFVIIFKNSKII